MLLLHIDTQQSLGCKELRKVHLNKFRCLRIQKSLKNSIPRFSWNGKINVTTKKKEDASVLPQILK